MLRLLEENKAKKQWDTGRNKDQDLSEKEFSYFTTPYSWLRRGIDHLKEDEENISKKFLGTIKI